MNSLLIVLVALVALTSCRNITPLGSRISIVPNPGEWGSPEYCPEGSFAIGFMIKQELNQNFFRDKTATNGIRLICDDNDDTIVTSSEGGLGIWKSTPNSSSFSYCRHVKRLKGFRLQVQSYWPFDNTGVDGVDFMCTTGQTMNYSVLSGPWSMWDLCPDDRAICGIKTRVQHKWNQDNVALSDILVYCCPLTRCILL